MLDRIIEFLDPYLDVPWGYFLVGLATFLENSVGAGVIVPGETLVIVGGFSARIGTLWLPLFSFVSFFPLKQFRINQCSCLREIQHRLATSQQSR